MAETRFALLVWNRWGGGGGRPGNGDKRYIQRHLAVRTASESYAIVRARDRRW
jgi:hypothetical protein